MSLDKNQVDIEWTPVRMDRVNAVWDTVKGMPPQTSSGQSGHVKVHADKGTVTFTLRPNQTFSSYTMRVVEGKVTPVTVDPKDNNGTKDNKDKAALPPAIQSFPRRRRNQKAWSPLICRTAPTKG